MPIYLLGCTGCRTKPKCLKKISGKCVLTKKSEWKECCKRISDPICETKNAECRELHKPVTSGLKKAKKEVSKSKLSFIAAKKTLDDDMALVNITKRSLDQANANLKAIKVSHSSGTQALSAIAMHTLDGIFDIQEASFDVALGVATSGQFRVSLICTIFKRVKKFSFDINFKAIILFIKSVGERIIPGLKKYIS